MKVKVRLSQGDQRHLLNQGRLEIERAKRIAYEGDWLEIDGRCFVFTNARVCFAPSHPHKRLAFVHTLRAQSELAKFHVHTIWGGRCSICGFIPSPEPLNTLQ